MKVLSIPSSGRCANIVAYVGRYGQCQRQWLPPADERTPAREFMRGAFGRFARAWGRGLSEEQRDRWNYAGPQVMSHPRLGQRGALTGQQHFEGINCVRARVGLAPVYEPPARVVLGINPVGQLVIEIGESGARLWLRVKGQVAEDIMVFGQAPCSAGRSKRRNVSYLGLASAAVDGLIEITGLYKARYGEPRAGTKVFIVTCQQKDGWKGVERVTSEIVPGLPAKHAKDAKREELKELKELSGLNGQEVAGDKGENGLKPLMHKGCTRGAQGTASPPAGLAQGTTEAGDGGEKAAGAASEGREGRGGGGDAPV